MTDVAQPPAAQDELRQRRALGLFLTFISFLSIPSLAVYFQHTHSWSFGKSIAIAFGVGVVGRALIDVAVRKYLPRPSLFQIEDPKAKAEDISDRRRAWFWRFWGRFGVVYGVISAITALKHHHSQVYELVHLLPNLSGHILSPSFLLQFIQIGFLFMANFVLFMGPMLAMGISQIKVYEPGDANFGVKMEDVRGQKEAKEEVRRLVNIWSSGEDFRKLGGKPDRGALFMGAPGVGKTFLAKAIATSFNAPFLVIPGSGFAQTFIGIDSIIVRFLSHRAKKAARKWGGQAIVFIDEIDAVGRRRSGMSGGQVAGPGGMFGGGMGQMALNQLLVVMDSIDGPPGMRRFFTKKINTFLDGIYFVPTSIGKLKLRLPTPKPRKEQVFWIGATNIALEELDEALIRPGRMGRHIYFRRPTKDDRKDVLDLYVGKVSHDPDLDRPERRDELARITTDTSPAGIEQLCSMALINAQHDGRNAFTYDDFVEALTSLESGSAIGVDYTPDETVATALHEAGHAAASHVYRTDQEHARLSIRMRSNSLGHHQFYDKEERFGHWRHEEFAALIHLLAAYASEHVFYNENGTGVSGDLEMTNDKVVSMVQTWGMFPYFFDVKAMNQRDEEVLTRFESIGFGLMPHYDDRFEDSDKGALAAQFLGHAYVTAWNFIRMNRDGIDNIAKELVEKKEIYGDDVKRLCDAQDLKEFDYTKIENFYSNDVWPNL